LNLIANSERTFSEASEMLLNLYAEFKYLRITVTTKRERTLDQNALWASLYIRISETLGDGSAMDIQSQKAYCKLMIGVPILRRDDEQFEKGWNRYFASRSYEEQLFLMGANPLFGVDGFPVTRLLDTKQGAEYTDSIDRHFAHQGVFFADLLDGKKK
jgi:hypothetical protein